MRALGTPRGLFLTAALGVSALPAISAIRDPDFWWHLRAGQLILERHSLLGDDPFTYTASSHHWTMHEWLSEVLFAALHSAGGLAPIVVLLCALTWLGILCIHLRARLHAPRYLPLGLGTILAAVAGYPIWGPRAQMITFALSCLLLYLVERHLLHGGRRIWLLVPLFLVWSNLHSGFIIGLGFLSVVIAAELLGWRLTPAAERRPPTRVRQLLLVLAACAGAALINPNGPGIVLYPFATQGSTAQQTVIQEWHSPDFHQWEVWGFGIMMLSLVAMVTVTRRMRPRDAALVTVTTLLALQSVRHIALFVAASTPAWIAQADLLAARVERRRAPRGTGAQPPAVLRAGALGLVAVVLVAAIGLKLAGALATREDSLVYARDLPVCAARWLAQARRPLSIFNQYGEGGYLVNALSGRGDRVFIFGDAALMGDDLLIAYADVESLRPRWDSVIRGSGTDVVLFDTGAALTTVLEASPRWTRVYHDPLNEAFVPAGEASRSGLPAQPDAGPPGSTCRRLEHEGLGPAGASGRTGGGG